MSTKLEMLDVQAVKTWESYQRFKKSIAAHLLKYSSRTVSTAPKSWEGLRKLLAEEDPNLPTAPKSTYLKGGSSSSP